LRGGNERVSFLLEYITYQIKSFSDQLMSLFFRIRSSSLNR